MLVACVQANDISVRTSAIDDRSPEDTGDDYEFQHLPTDAYATQKPGFYAVHGDGDWQSVWLSGANVGDHPPLPSVDFKTHMLFVATSKTPEAKSIEVQKITRTADGLHVYVLETLPLANCPVEPKKGPAMDIVQLDNVPFDMHVVYDRVHADSCGPPPDAIVQCRIAGSGTVGADKITASPGENIDCDGSQSKPQVGKIISRKWELNAAPPGSATKLTVGKDAIGVTFPVDAWGVYQVGLDVRDATRDGDGLGIVEVLPPNVGVELYWARPPSDPAQLPRVELHVIEMPFGIGSSGDCTVNAQKSFCELHNAVTLQQAALRPEPNKRYRVVVKYLDARVAGGPTACVRAFAKGEKSGHVEASSCDAEDASRAKGSSWDVGALDAPHAAFYDSRLPKPPVVAAPSADAGAPAPSLTAPVVIPPPVTPRPAHTATPPPAPTSSASIEL